MPLRITRRCFLRFPLPRLLLPSFLPIKISILKQQSYNVDGIFPAHARYLSENKNSKCEILFKTLWESGLLLLFSARTSFPILLFFSVSCLLNQLENDIRIVKHLSSSRDDYEDGEEVEKALKIFS